MLTVPNSETFCNGNQISFGIPGGFDLAAHGWGYGRPKSYECWAANEDESSIWAPRDAVVVK
jgi:hypothetical protein